MFLKYQYKDIDYSNSRVVYKRNCYPLITDLFITLLEWLLLL